MRGGGVLENMQTSNVCVWYVRNLKWKDDVIGITRDRGRNGRGGEK